MRGKCGTAAATRHDANDRDAEIAAYRRNVARLTDENRQLRADLEAERATVRAAAETARRKDREFRARLDAGAAPKIAALEQQTDRVRTERDRALARAKEIQQLWDTAITRIASHFKEDHRLKHLPAFEAALHLVGPRDADGAPKMLSDDADRLIRQGVPTEVVKLIQRKQGDR